MYSLVKHFSYEGLSFVRKLRRVVLLLKTILMLQCLGIHSTILLVVEMKTLTTWKSLKDQMTYWHREFTHALHMQYLERKCPPPPSKYLKTIRSCVTFRDIKHKTKLLRTAFCFLVFPHDGWIVWVVDPGVAQR